MNISAFYKDENSIIGRIPLLGLYEVKEKSIDLFRIQGKTVSFYSDNIFLFSETMKRTDMYEIGIYDTDFIWFQIAPNRIGDVHIGRNNSETTILMFEPTYLQPIIRRFITKYDEIIRRFDDITRGFVERNNELDFLKETLELIEFTGAKNGIISPSFG